MRPAQRWFVSPELKQAPLTTSQAFVSIWYNIQVFKPEFVEKVGQPVQLISLCLAGFIASILAIFAAGWEELDVGLILASLGGSSIHCASSWWANGPKSKVLQPITLGIVVAEVLAPLSHYLVSLLRNNVIRRSNQLSLVCTAPTY